MSANAKEVNTMVDLIKRDPFTNLVGFPRWFDDFDDLSSQKGLKVYETDKNIVAEAVIAGIPSDDVEVHIEDGVLTIKGENTEEEKGKEGFTKSSYKYYYTCALSGGQWDKADAEVENGVVKVTIPKTESARPRKITVKAKSK